jgi:hypothetical protein
LRPRADPARAEIRYVERRRPLARVAELVERVRLRGWREVDRGPIEALVTDEGEYAAQITLRGTLDGLPVVRSFGFVFFDDFVARLVGLARAPEEAPRLVETVRKLVRLDTHLAGLRRRRYVYAPPDAALWHGYLMPPFHAYYLPLTYPSDPSTIAVYPAIPGTGEALVDAVLASGPGVQRRTLGAPAHLVAASGLSGLWHTLHAGQHTWDLVVLGDDRYSYAMMLRTIAQDRERHAAVFQAMARSIEPLPRPRGARGGELGSAALGHWND